LGVRTKNKRINNNNKMKRKYKFLWIIGLAVLFGACRPASPQQVVSLNGEWQIAKTGGALPEVFPATVPALNTTVCENTGELPGSPCWTKEAKSNG
jgi:hypothetical protein